jgi:hypothetical protein
MAIKSEIPDDYYPSCYFDPNTVSSDNVDSLPQKISRVANQLNLPKSSKVDLDPDIVEVMAYDPPYEKNLSDEEIREKQMKIGAIYVVDKEGVRHKITRTSEFKYTIEKSYTDENGKFQCMTEEREIKGILKSPDKNSDAMNCNCFSFVFSLGQKILSSLSTFFQSLLKDSQDFLEMRRIIR